LARLARVVIPGLPHHLLQRGNRREPAVFKDGDYGAYLDLISAAARRSATAIWAYCLIPNHVRAGQNGVTPRDITAITQTWFAPPAGAA
jgi:putative transposase